MRESSSEMDTIEFWIWEHATKYGMTKVLTKMKEKSSSFTYITPNSWLSALYLRQIKNEWSELDSKISPKEINALKETLTSTFKHYKEDLKHFIKTSVCIQLDLFCKAAFLVMRSTESKPSVKSQVRDKLFPCWNMDMWIKMKDSFGLKDDLIMEEIKQFYMKMRLKLCQVDQQKKILDQFGDMMKKHFPSLISFMQKIKLSRLERIQLNKMKLDKQYEFLRVILNGGLVNELVVLDLLEDVQKKKIIESALEFLKEAKMDETPTDTSSREIKLYTLPPDSMFENNDVQIYPACFLRNSFMSTEIAIRNGAILEEMVINRNIPLKPDGKDFGPLWFSDTTLIITKIEKTELSNERDSFKLTENFPVALSTYNDFTSNHSIKVAAPDGLTNEKQLSPITIEKKPTKCTADNDGGTNFKNCNPQLNSKVSIIGAERVNLIQSWINNNPDSHSSIENGISLNELNRKETLSLPSKIIENCKLPFDKIVTCESLAPILNPPSSEENLGANSSKLKTSELRPSDAGALTEYESSERWIPPSDTEYVSSTAASSTSSCRRMQTRTRYKHLTELANREKWKEAANHRLVEYGDETDDSRSLNYGHRRRLRSQSGKPNAESISVQVTRSKKKCRKLSSSSSSSGYSANSEILQRAPADKRKKQLANKSNGTPLPDEPLTFHYPDQQNSKCSKENNALESSALRTGIKRKLDLDEQPISDSPKSKRVPVENLPDGKRILPNIVETLQKHSEQLLLNDPFFSKHCKKLDLCIQHVLRSHHKLIQSDDNDASTRVKHCPKDVFLD